MQKDLVSQMRKRWEALWTRRDPKLVANAFALIVAQYSEPHRHYHNLEHIAASLHEFDRVRSLVVDARCIELALWYHDIIYDSRAENNEEQSAHLAWSELGRLECTPDMRNRVSALIMSTEHDTAVTELDHRIIVDIDLSILGADEKTFDAYGRAIREEYDWVPEKDYREGRRAVLQAFLDRPSIYSHSVFRARYERSARENLKRAIWCLV